MLEHPSQVESQEAYCFDSHLEVPLKYSIVPQFSSALRHTTLLPRCSEPRSVIQKSSDQVQVSASFILSESRRGEIPR